MVNNSIRRFETFNPLDKSHLGESVADALLDSEVEHLPPVPFEGAGVYAIYYTGPFPAYSSIANRNTDSRYSQPLYVGKAVPAGARKGNVGLGIAAGQVMSKRLSEHSKSIDQANNLDLKDFACRFLVVEDIWIPLAESLLISKFSPLWNKKIDGFGNHDPGKGRYAQRRSQWDTLHPGRNWAERLAPSDTNSDTIEQTLGKYIFDNQ